MTLKDQIEELTRRLNMTSAVEEGLVRELAGQIAAADDRLQAELDAVIHDHETRRRGVVERLQTLAARLGYLPHLAPQPHLAPAAPPPLPNVPPVEERFSWQRPSFLRDEPIDAHQPYYTN